MCIIEAMLLKLISAALGSRCVVTISFIVYESGNWSDRRRAFASEIVDDWDM